MQWVPYYAVAIIYCILSSKRAIFTPLVRGNGTRYDRLGSFSQSIKATSSAGKVIELAFLGISLVT